MIRPLPEVVARRANGQTVISLQDVYKHHLSGSGSGDLALELSARGAVIDFAMPAPQTATCFAWFLNGPGDGELGLLRGTKRDRTTRYMRARDGEPDRVRELEDHGLAWDFLYVPPPADGTGRAALSRVPKSCAPETAKPWSLEYVLNDSGRPPDPAMLDAQAEALGFAIGRRLIPVGYSVFDERIFPVRHVLRPAWAVDLGADCRRPSCPPVPLGDPGATANEDAIGDLVSRFRAESVTCALSDALWLVRLSEAVPLDSALPYIASALEAVMTAWFRSAKTKSKGKYMAEDDWKRISEEALKALEQALGKHPDAQRILRRAAGANSFGVNERFERFFGELALPVGQVELKAIAARNKAAHGGGYDPGMYAALSATVRAYRTLFHRVALRVIGWSGPYVDYSTYGFPSRPLLDCLGGPAGDGVPA
jgi:hypothetical protein